MYVGPWQEYYMSKKGGAVSSSQNTGITTKINGIDMPKLAELENEMLSKEILIENVKATLADCLDPAAAAKALQSLYPVLNNNIQQRSTGSYSPSIVATNPPRRIPPPGIGDSAPSSMYSGVESSQYSNKSRHNSNAFDQHAYQGYNQQNSSRSEQQQQGRMLQLTGRSSLSEPTRGTKGHGGTNFPPSSGNSTHSYQSGSSGIASSGYKNNGKRFHQYNGMSTNEITQLSQFSRNKNKNLLQNVAKTKLKPNHHALQNPASIQSSARRNPVLAEEKLKPSYHAPGMVRLLQQDREYRIQQAIELKNQKELEELEFQLTQHAPNYNSFWGWGGGSSKNKGGVQSNANVDKVQQMRNMYMQHVPSVRNSEQEDRLDMTDSLAPTAANTANAVSANPRVNPIPTKSNEVGVSELQLNDDEFMAVSKYFDIRPDNENVGLCPTAHPPPSKKYPSISSPNTNIKSTQNRCIDSNSQPHSHENAGSTDRSPNRNMMALQGLNLRSPSSPTVLSVRNGSPGIGGSNTLRYLESDGKPIGIDMKSGKSGIQPVVNHRGNNVLLGSDSANPADSMYLSPQPSTSHDRSIFSGNSVACHSHNRNGTGSRSRLGTATGAGGASSRVSTGGKQSLDSLLKWSADLNMGSIDDW